MLQQVRALRSGGGHERACRSEPCCSRSAPCEAGADMTDAAGCGRTGWFGLSLSRAYPRPAVHSLAEAAAARGVAPADVIKTLVVRRAENDYLFVLVPGDRVISWPKLRGLLRVKRMTMPDAAEALTGQAGCGTRHHHAVRSLACVAGGRGHAGRRPRDHVGRRRARGRGRGVGRRRYSRARRHGRRRDRSGAATKLVCVVACVQSTQANGMCRSQSSGICPVTAYAPSGSSRCRVIAGSVSCTTVQ